jgi:hypothetical protein
VDVASPFLLRSVEPPLAACAGGRVVALRRIGKRIVVGLEEQLFLVIHLMIAGRLHWKPAGAKLPGKLGERVVPDEDEGKPAVTRYRVVSHAGDKLAWLALMPITGRTHQLRAHCAALGTPILGDGKYGGAASRPEGVPEPRKLHLHARSLVLPRPDGSVLKITAPLPPHMKATFRFLGFEESEGRGVFEDE